MSDEPQTTDTQPTNQDAATGDDASWNKLRGLIRKEIDDSWAAHSPTSSIASDSDQKETKDKDKKEPPKKSWLEKIITG